MPATRFILMLKKILIAIASFALITSVQTPASHSAIKAGAACKKIGIKSKVGNKTFTCIKSGKKLVWNKGVKENAPAQRFSVVSIEDLNSKNVYGRSRQEVNDAIDKSNYVNTYLNFNIGPNQNSSVVSAEKDSLNKAARLWATVYQPKEQLEVLFYNFTDLEWAKTKYTQITGAQTFYSANSCSINYCGNASAGKSGNSPWIYEQGLGGSLWNKSTSAHEYTHLAQTSGNSNYWNIAPIWLVEGMAQFYGEAIGYFPFDSMQVTRGEMHRQYAADFNNANPGELKSLLARKDSSTVKTLMQSVEFPNPRHGQAITAAAYLLGSYGSEVLVAVYGHSSVEQFIKSFANSMDWKSNFSSSFGITIDDFYLKLTPYLYEMSKEL
jgi:hypothetical protein